ncbi:MAG: hypothetical protein ACP5I3_12305, partial [Thermoproteus sp.]
MWRELVVAVKYLLRWRVETSSSALAQLSDARDDKQRRMALRMLSAAELGTVFKERGLLPSVVSLTRAFEEWGISRKAASQLLYLYLAAVYTALISAVRSRLDMFLTMAVTLIVTSFALGGIMAAMVPQALWLVYISIAATAALLPLAESTVPPLGKYDYRPAVLMPVGAVAGYLLGGVKGFAVGLFAAALPMAVVWFRSWLAYEFELARVDRLLEAAADGEPVGRGYIAEEVRSAYEHVHEVGAYDMELLSRELMLFMARYWHEVRSLARGRGLTLAVLFVAAVAVMRIVVSFMAS